MTYFSEREEGERPGNNEVIGSGDDRYPKAEDVEVIGVNDMAKLLAEL